MKKTMHRPLNIQHFEYPKDIDQELIHLLDAINSVPGLRSMFCCCGHGKEEFYVMLACCNIEVAKEVFKVFNLPFQKDAILAISDYSNSRITLKSGRISSEDDKFFAYLDSPELSRRRGFTKQEKICITIYSTVIGELKYKKRKSEITKLEKKFLKLVPEKHW